MDENDGTLLVAGANPVNVAPVAECGFRTLDSLRRFVTSTISTRAVLHIILSKYQYSKERLIM